MLFRSDNDWEKHTTFDIENLFGTNSENDNVINCYTISTIHVPSNDDIESSKLGDEVFENPFATDDYIFETSPSSKNDEEYGLDMLYDNALDDGPMLIDNPPDYTIEEKNYFDNTMSPIYDDYNDECDIFSPPTIEEKVYYDHDMPPIYDDNNDGYDSFTPYY